MLSASFVWLSVNCWNIFEPSSVEPSSVEPSSVEPRIHFILIIIYISL